MSKINFNLGHNCLTIRGRYFILTSKFNSEALSNCSSIDDLERDLILNKAIMDFVATGGINVSQIDLVSTLVLLCSFYAFNSGSGLFSSTLAYFWGYVIFQQ